ncbi:MAG TPA: sensor histidine kinase [Caulobacteraceae bacterium]|nr:sensor histidine kinase [Caulobacteraceae bacterium]
MRPPSRLGQMEFARHVVHAAAAPLLLLDRDLQVVAASPGYLRAFVDSDSPEGRRLEEITGGAWSEARVQALIAHARLGEPITAVDTVVACPEGRRRVRVAIMPTHPEASDESPLVVAIEDLTELAVREATREAKLQEAEALLHEAQHRTANNLAMIASVLGIKAKSVSSEETRSELEGARERLVAMATIERHLQLGRPKDPTDVRPYLEELCRQLSASLVGDARQIEIVVDAQSGSQPRRTAVILGLVVTESVINALKYAFPANRGGRILVEYWETAEGWGAAVSDEGTGLRDGDDPKSGGLGTAILETLALQLNAKASLTNSSAGLRVELSCEGRGD